MNNYLLAVENLRIGYRKNRVWAVDGVSFQLQPGEVMALVGESGCGKSSIARAIMGLLPSDTVVEGDIKFEGQSIFSYNKTQWRHFRGERVGLVFQDPMTRLNPLMTIGNHLLETLKAHHPRLSPQQAREKAEKCLETVRIPPDRFHQYPHELSGGMRQRVAIGLAILLEPKLIIADEPTTSLDVTIARQILEELTSLCRQRGMALLLISHDLALVARYCENIAVMYQGQIVEMGAVRDVIYNPKHQYSRTLLQAAFRLHQHDSNPNRHRGDNNQTPLLELKNVRQYYTLTGNFLQQWLKGLKKGSKTIRAVDDVSLRVWEGETVGIVGESGCGKSTLSRTILQLLPPQAGQILWRGQDVSTFSGKQLRAWRREVQMIFQDPHACLNPMMTVGEAIAEPLVIHRLGNKRENRQTVEEMLYRVGLDPTIYYNRYPRELSGGQQQRVAIARALITHPRLVICDEPVSMLDATVQAQVLELMLALKQEFNLTYIFITHDLSVARFFCNRIAVMYQGQIVELADTHTVFHQPQHPYTQTLLASSPSLVL
ncbi:MAG: ABC transporter ATP-binding protein [Geminocystis sp.]|nr:ABC transporter ATP-binding protein [Geminocystis sp.]